MIQYSFFWKIIASVILIIVFFHSHFTIDVCILQNNLRRTEYNLVKEKLKVDNFFYMYTILFFLNYSVSHNCQSRNVILVMLLFHEFKFPNENFTAHSESNRIAYANIPLPEVLPVFNSMGTGVYAKQSLVEKAYEQHEPSKFYIKMCKATWSNQELSKRCIKKTKRSRGKKVLTPKRKRAVRGHFVKYLKDLQFPPLLQKIHITSINEYGRRAINAAGSHNQRNDGDEIDELDEDAEMIEL